MFLPIPTTFLGQKGEKKAILLKGFHEYGKVITDKSNFLKKRRDTNARFSYRRYPFFRRD